MAILAQLAACFGRNEHTLPILLLLVIIILIREGGRFRWLRWQWRSATVAATILGCRRGRASLPPGKALRRERFAELLRVRCYTELSPPGWKPGSTAAMMAAATFSRQTLHLLSRRSWIQCDWFWKGGGSPSARVEGGKSELHRARCRVTQARSVEIHAGGDGASRPDGQCHRKQTARVAQATRVRGKRWCKRPPREAQATRHGKPHRVQGQIGNRGAARSASAKVDRFRVLAAKTNDSLRSQERRQKSAYSPSRTIS